MRCCESLRGVRSEAHAVHALIGLQFHSGIAQNTVGHFELIANSFHVVIPERRRHTASTRSKGGHPMFGRSVCHFRAEQMTHTTCCLLIRRVSQWTKPPSSSRNVALFLQYPVFSSMTRFAHCNRIFARSRHCNGVVSHAWHCVLIAASAVQQAETVLVGLAPRCQDANATRNIPHVESTTEVVIGSMWKRALVRKLNTQALSSEIPHVADASLFTDFLSVHFFRSLPAPLSRFETDCFLILPPTGLTGRRYTEGASSLLKKFLFLRLQIQRSSVAGVCRLASERSGEDHVQHQCRVSSIRHVVKFVVTAAVVLRDNICAAGVCEAHDSSTCFDLHSAVMCMEFALDIEYVPQHEQCLTWVFSQF